MVLAAAAAARGGGVDWAAGWRCPRGGSCPSGPLRLPAYVAALPWRATAAMERGMQVAQRLTCLGRRRTGHRHRLPCWISIPRRRGAGRPVAGVCVWKARGAGWQGGCTVWTDVGWAVAAILCKQSAAAHR